MKIYLDTVGCRLNQAEIDGMGRQFRAAGYEVVGEVASADLAVVNTCCVTAGAAADSRSLIRRLGRMGTAEVVVTGCWATLHPADTTALPGVQRVVPNMRKDELVAELVGGSMSASALALGPRLPLPGLRRRTRAFIKVQDGCDNGCTFCATTIARGTGRSRSTREVLADVQAAATGGAKEVVLTGVHLASWGHESGMQLEDLLRVLLRETDMSRIRLSSLEPWDLNPGFFELWPDRRLCNHFHFPLQSGCAATLRRMARRTSPAAFKALVGAARAAVADAAITTDVIAGFPGESEYDFRTSLEFVKEMRFAGGHAFTYSPMPGTAAARMRAQIPAHERRRRNHAYLDVLEEAAREFRLQHVGRTCTVLWESAEPIDRGGWSLSGLTTDYVRVWSWSPDNRWNELDDVTVQEADSGGVRGMIAKTG